MSNPGPFNGGQALREALALHQSGRLDEAEKLYTRVLKHQRDNFDALHLYGMLNHQRGKAGEAYRLISAALKVQPRSADALANFALVLHGLKRTDEAFAALDKALAIAPGHIDALNHRGNFQAERGRPEAALNDYDAALRVKPGHPLVLYNRGNALRALGREEEALAAYDATLRAMPNHAGALSNRGLARAALNRHAEALESYGRALSLQPDRADTHFNASLSLLTAGDYPRGFAEYEWRHRLPGAPVRADLRGPPWLGETPLAGKTLLLHGEQGFGDTVMFARYAPELARAGATVAMEVPPELKALLAALSGVSAIVGRGERLPAFDLHCPLPSLPLACKTALSSVPANIPYLNAPEAAVAKWRVRLEQRPAPRIALAWSGRATHINDRNRSLPLAALEPLLAVPGVSFIGLQRDLRDTDAQHLKNERIDFVGDELADFTDTAAIVALADLTVCVDTSVAHVAGALGRPAIVMLPFQPDWRWTLDRDSSPWYPALRLFRQPRPGDWASVIERVRGEIARLSL